jgi:MFS family permease
MYTHLFFAQRYKENWFSLTDQNSALDFSTYPPLAHQIIALLSFVFPLKVSYYIVLIIFWILLSYFSTKFFFNYLKVKDEKFWLTYLFIFFSSGILVTVFVFGQLTTIVGLAFGFISLYYFSEFLKKGSLKNAFLSLLSLSLSAFSHNFSFLLIGLFYFFIVIFEWRTLLKRSKQFILPLACAIFLILVIYYPSLTKLFSTSLVPSKEVPHWSRYPFISSINFERWLSIYGISIFMLALPLFLILSKTKRWKRFLKLYLIAIIFFLLGLGRVTPLTKIFLGLEYWLTYERFSLVSSIILTSFFALFIPTKVSFKKRKLNFLPIIFLILFVGINLEWLYHSHTLFFGNPVKTQDNKRQEITSYVLSFLNNVSSDYRYQTFGYGRPIGEIYLYSKLPTLDTDYFTGRTIHWIKDSGIDEIDQTKDKNFLDTFMNHTNEYSVKYILTFNDFYHQYMKLYSWKLLESRSFDGKSVMIWENPNKVKEISLKKEEIGVFNYVWGILPLTTLFTFLILLWKYRLR